MQAGGPIRSEPRSSKRDRSNEAWYVARGTRVDVRRPYPNHVDVGSAEFPVRYDPEQGVYDLRDALRAAYGNERAVNVTAQKMGKNFKLTEQQFQKLKWSDGGNTGPGRIAVTAATCARLLRESIALHSRTPPLSVTQVQLWFEQQAGCRTQPSILDSTTSAHALHNTRT
jgi:hypothetical protein